jgi:hypothetical protein
MSIDFEHEEAIPLRLAVELVPRSSRTKRHVHFSVLYRWVSRGLVCGQGKRVYLEAERAGSTLCTTRSAIRRFLVATAGHGTAARTGKTELASDAEGNTEPFTARLIAEQLDEAGL